MTRRIYMDYASTTPTDPAVITAMQPYFFEAFGNPASPHYYGHEASKALESAREQTAGFIGAKADDIVFTSSATEAVNHVMFAL
ncbi:MAG: aminotransferase class V-fold PLP-dependent enzyme, partial [Thermodesulfovibrionia bacterium]|nr:aminotransferase class V-fold PLP-dependent enzyme [Thermodesulfovibrionia bacterium]